MDAAWLAGFFDGEGSIGIYRARHNKQIMLTVVVSQKDRMILDLIAAAYPEGKVYRNHTPTGRLGKKCHMAAFHLNGSKAKRFLEDIRPYVIVKKAQVEMGLKFIELLLPKVSFGRCYPKLDAAVIAEREQLMASMKAEKDRIRNLVN